MGSWANFIPGFIAPNGSKIAEPLLVDPANYFVTFTSTVMAGAWAMRKVKEKWPKVNTFVQSLCAIPAIWVAMGILDVVATQFLHFDGWLIAKWDLSLFRGNFYQFPIYEFLVFPLAFLACALLVYISALACCLLGTGDKYMVDFASCMKDGSLNKPIFILIFTDGYSACY